ncbi:MAG: EamA family transporter, partial [Candidatus Baltobacteraceae bacterium]
WCLQTIPSGIGSLFFSLAPLWMAIFAAVLFGERLTLPAALGLALGFGGMAYLIAPHGAVHFPFWPTALGVFSSVAWAFGSVLQRRFAFVDLLQASAMQMLVAAVVLAAVAIATGERVSAASFSPATLGALAFLVICGSVIGYSCYLYVMREAATTLASTYAYVNPVVALAIGSLLLHEALTTRTLLGAIVIVAGVALMIASPKAADRAEKKRVAAAA